MKKKLNIETWDRKEHFHFFKSFEEPFFGITVEIDCTQAYRTCKHKQQSFFLYYLHKALMAANQVEAFRYRIIEDEVYVFDTVEASATINRENGTFGFSYILFDKDFSTFTSIANEEIDRVRSTQKLMPDVLSENVIHFSSIPWINFTSLSHARKYSIDDSCPKISFGKMTERDQKRFLSVSIHVHHALMDGYHVGQFVDAFQKFMNEE
jgi:chloramphenicol O-acetyltransferase type A